MCGLVGLIAPTGFGETRGVSQLVTRMRDQIRHRGPDDAGLWIDQAGGTALGFRRLSIIDVSSAGHQPMLSGDDRFAVVMNGEIYNFQELKREIESESGTRNWRGHSDTEILVEAIALWGFEAAIRRANGMFAVATWDREERTLWLARDRIGKKPLYYGWAGQDFVFASEVKALWPHPSFDFMIDPIAQMHYMQLGYVLGERTIFRALKRLPNGNILRLTERDRARHELPRPAEYWSLREIALAGIEERASGKQASVEEFEALLDDAVRIRMVSDVPLGSFLSGGIDSSLVTSVMAAGSTDQVLSFSIGFHVQGRDEAPYALAVARHLGTRHEELYVNEDDIISTALDLPAVYDEPFADDSAIPTLLLCRMARRQVTVALSGDGGDELFAGYDRYAVADKWLSRSAAIPGPARSLAAGAISAIVQPLARPWAGHAAQRRLELLRRLLALNEAGQFQESVMSQVFHPGCLMGRNGTSAKPLTDGGYALGRSSPIDRMTFMDLGSYLIDDILMKVDRASMAASLEVRCPLLDHRIIEQSWRFPSTDKTDGKRHKMMLRKALYKHVPPALVDRPKSGFGAPVEVWLRGELRDWAEELLSHDALASHGMLNADACRRLWENFIARGRGWHRGIWHVLMFQAWHASLPAAAVSG
ncbi:MAG: asparagine synthase (glutamine-hydrolyzing) [Acetobacteraceae bacterium]